MNNMKSNIKKDLVYLLLFLIWSVFPFGVFYCVGEYISNRIAIFVGVSSILIFFLISKKVISTKRKRLVLTLVSPMFLYFVTGVFYLGYSDYKSEIESKVKVANESKIEKSTLVILETSKIGIGYPNTDNIFDILVDTLSIASNMDNFCDDFVDTFSTTSYITFIEDYMVLDISVLPDKDLILQVQDIQIYEDEGCLLKAIDEYGRIHRIIMDNTAIYLRYDDMFFKFYPIKVIDVDEYENSSKLSNDKIA